MSDYDILAAGILLRARIVIWKKITVKCSYRHHHLHANPSHFPLDPHHPLTPDPKTTTV